MKWNIRNNSQKKQNNFDVGVLLKDIKISNIFYKIENFLRTSGASIILSHKNIRHRALLVSGSSVIVLLMVLLLSKRDAENTVLNKSQFDQCENRHIPVYLIPCYRNIRISGFLHFSISALQHFSI